MGWSVGNEEMDSAASTSPYNIPLIPITVTHVPDFRIKWHYPRVFWNEVVSRLAGASCAKRGFLSMMGNSIDVFSVVRCIYGTSLKRLEPGLSS